MAETGTAELEMLERYSLYNLFAIVAGGLLAAFLINPDLEAGPVRVTTYVVGAIAAMLLSAKYLRVVRSSNDGKASIFVVAGTYLWISLSFAFLFVAYLVFARAIGFSPHLPAELQLRVSYFFISGAMVGALFKAVVFYFVPTQVLTQRRVPAWPLTALKSRRR